MKRIQTIATAMLLATCLCARTFAAAPASRPAWNEIHSFCYQLQAADLHAIANSKFDLAVIDYSADASDSGRYTKKHIATVQQSGKRVLAYMSLGEAEDYRWYWQSDWKKPASAPAWLGPLNPDWPGNFKVKYWDPGWQKIEMEYLDKIIDAGFDGVYLDVIDAYEFWGPDGEGKLNRATAEQEMVDLVKAIATHAHETRGVKDFAVFVQNCEELARHADYLAAVSGIGREDLFYNTNKPQPTKEIKFAIGMLRKFKDGGKPVLVIDYPTQNPKIDDVYKRAADLGFIPYVAPRELDKLQINAGHEP